MPAEGFGGRVVKELLPGGVYIEEAIFFGVGNGDGVRKGLEGLANEPELLATDF